MATDVCKVVGKRIKALRLERGWTQQALADHAELSREQICWIEQGKTEVGLRAFKRIVDALGANAEELIR